LCGTRKYPYPHHRGSLEILRRRGSYRPKFLKESMSLNWNLQRVGGGSNQKILCGRSMDIFRKDTLWQAFCAV